MAQDGEDTADNLAEERNQIMKLQSDIARKQEEILHLKAKEQALREEWQYRYSELKAERQPKMDDKRALAKTEAKQEEATAHFIRSDVLQLLKERIPIIAEPEGDDEEENILPSDKKDQQETSSGTMHHSVLVRYFVVSQQSSEGKFIEFYVTYRIDRTTTIAGLHKDACAYWGCSPSEYDLYNQTCDLLSISDSRLLNEVLPPNVNAILHLVDRADVQSWKAHMEEQKKKEEQQQGGIAGGGLKEETGSKKIMSGNKTGMVSESGKQFEPFVQALKDWPGLQRLLANRPMRGRTTYGSGVAFKDILGSILVLIFLTVATSLRTSFDSNALYRSVHEATVEGIRTQSSIGLAQDFRDIRRYDDIWNWLGGSFHYQVFNPASNLRQFSEPVGVLQIRQQIVKEASECRRPELENALSTDAKCYHVEVHSDTILRQNLIINGSFLTYDGSDTGRIERDVLAYEDAPDTYLPLSGVVQARYDGDGYKAQYLLTPENISDAGNALLEDIAFFSGHWLTLQTRLLTVEMTWANYHRGGYLSAVYMFEIPPSGYIQSSAHLRPFMADSSSASEAADGLELFTFIVLWLWVIGFRVYAEVTKKVNMKRPGYWYLFSFGGFLDMQIVALPIVILVMKGLNTMPKPYELTYFFSFNRNAFYFRQLNITRSLLYCTLMLRACTFAKLVPNVTQLLKVLTRSAFYFIWYVLIVLPVFLGVIFLGNTIYVDQLYYWSTWRESILTTILLLRMDANMVEMETKAPFVTVVFLSYFIICVQLFLLLGFMALTVHAYFEVKIVEAPSEKTRWSLDQWLDWSLFGFLYTIITGKKPGVSRTYEADKVDDDVESGSESDDDDAGAPAKDG